MPLPESQVLYELVEWASNDPAIRVVILAGSRANSTATPDELSDYDIEVYAENLETLFANNQWFLRFGKMIGLISEDHGDRLTRLVLYEKGLRIDFQVYLLEEFHRRLHLPAEECDWDIGFRVLVDKDSMTASMRPATNSRFVTKAPSQSQYLGLVNDFLWDITYVAKCLRRDELVYAKYMLDSVIRFSYLNRMIEWHIGLKYNWIVNPNKFGREFKKYLDKETWIQLESTFSGHDLEENWRALDVMITLFRTLARQVGQSLNFVYPEDLDIRVNLYIHQIKDSEKTEL